MRAGKLVLLGLLAILACPIGAQAAISDYFDLTGGLNTVDFVNREVVIRGTNPNNMTFINPLVTPLQAGDLIVSVFRAQDLTVQGSGSPAWTAGSDGTYFSGYSVQQVSFAGVGVAIYTNPSWDPYGVLSAGETLRLYEDPTDWVVDGNTIQQGVTSVTDGSLYASFTITGGYATLQLFNPAEGVAFAGLNNVPVAGSGAQADGLNFIPSSPSPYASLADISARATVQPNSNGPLSSNPQSQWLIESYGPMSFKAVPEPGTLALWGGCLAIGAVFALRRRNK